MVLNVKWGIYAAVGALLLAFTTSIFLGQAGFVISLLRGLAFAALFFILGVGIWTLLNTFIPELLFPESMDAAANIFGPESSDSQSSDSGAYGSHINITLGDRSDAALPDSDGPDSDEVGNISDLVSGTASPAGEVKRERGLDEITEKSYTVDGEAVASSLNGLAEHLPSNESGGFAMNFDSFTMGGGLAGLETYGDSFLLPPDSGGTARREEASLPERKVTGNTPKALEGDFNPKDIALGIRTVLETDKKG
jgi:hypothetical protein